MSLEKLYVQDAENFSMHYISIHSKVELKMWPVLGNNIGVYMTFIIGTD